jgi:hypothetical protein
LEIKQQIADSKNKIEVATVSDFVDHRPVTVSNIDSFNVPKPAVQQAVAAPIANELDADERDWDVPTSAVASDTSTTGAAEAAEALVRRKK